MGYGDVLVHTTGPSYGQNIVRNVGVSSGGGGGGAPDSHAASHEDGGADELDLTGLSGGFQNPFPDPVTFLDTVSLIDDKILALSTNGLEGFKFDSDNQVIVMVGPNGTLTGATSLNLWADPLANGGRISLGSSGVNIEKGLTLDPGEVGFAPLSIPAGVAPSSPFNGDIWIDAAGDIFLRRAGVTKQFAFV